MYFLSDKNGHYHISLPLLPQTHKGLEKAVRGVHFLRGEEFMQKDTVSFPFLYSREGVSKLIAHKAWGCAHCPC